MIEHIAQAIRSAEGDINLEHIVAGVTSAPRDYDALKRKFLKTERKIHGQFADFTEDRPVIATRRYSAPKGSVQWEVDAYSPVTIDTTDETVLTAIPFVEKKVVNQVGQETRTETGIKYEIVPCEETLQPREIGFYISTLGVDAVLASNIVARPWVSSHDPSIAVVSRPASVSVTSDELRIIDTLPNQRLFGQFLNEVVSLE